MAHGRSKEEANRTSRDATGQSTRGKKAISHMAAEMEVNMEGQVEMVLSGGTIKVRHGQRQSRPHGAQLAPLHRHLFLLLILGTDYNRL